MTVQSPQNQNNPANVDNASNSSENPTPNAELAAKAQGQNGDEATHHHPVLIDWVQQIQPTSQPLMQGLLLQEHRGISDEVRPARGDDGHLQQRFQQGDEENNLNGNQHPKAKPKQGLAVADQDLTRSLTPATPSLISPTST